MTDANRIHAGHAALSEEEIADLSLEDTQRLIAQLQLHQLELSNQNDELRQIQQELESSRQALAESETRYRDLYEFAPVAYLTTDLGGTIEAANLSAARLLHLPREQLIGRKLSDFVSARDQDRWYLERTRLGEKSDLAFFQVEMERPAGETFQAEVVAVLEDAVQGRASEIRVAAVDVSARHRQEAALRTAAVRELMTQQGERRALAEELHGGIEQSLAIVGLKLGGVRDQHGVEALDELAESIKTISHEIAAFGMQLFPTAIHDVGIAAAAQWLAEDVERKTGVHVRVEELDASVGEPDHATRLLLFETLRELLRNVTRHSGARKARVRFAREGWHIVLEVSDAGSGFETDAETKGLGLLQLRERLNQFGGRLKVRSSPGRGTRVCATIPFTIDETQREQLHL